MVTCVFKLNVGLNFHFLSHCTFLASIIIVYRTLPMHMSSVDLYKRQAANVVLLLDKTGPQETRPVFIHSQNFYFQFHYKLFCIKEVHLSDKLSLMCPRLWHIEDICISIYVLKCLLNVRHILEKVMSMQHSFEEFSEKQRRVELKSVGNVVTNTMLVESTNRFSLEELCRTQYSLKHFTKPYRQSDPLKNLNFI